MSNAIKYILFGLILFCLVFPGLQKKFAFYDIPPLDGDFVKKEKTDFSRENWLNGTYQQKYDAYLENNIGFRNFFVRLNNQINFSFFNKPFADGVIAGKNGQLYEIDYIRAYTGGDFLGNHFIDKNLRRFKYLQDTLKKLFDIDLILIFEPGKASFYPENIPDRFINNKKENSNYEVYSRKADSLGINHLDLNNYFKSIKEKSEYPLFTKNGTHWSVYGANTTADSIIKFIECKRNIDLPEIYIDTISYTTEPWGTDNDISKTMNLLWEPQMDTMAYPVLKFGDSTNKIRPKTLVVADSYYWNIYNTNLPKYLFKDDAFWYFYAKAYSKKHGYGADIKDINIINEIENKDIIIVSVTERFLYKFDWGFINDIYKVYGPYTELDKTHSIITGITKNDDWFTNIINYATLQNISLEKALEINADYVFKESEKELYMKTFGKQFYINKIRNDKNWLLNIKEKAKKSGIPFEDALKRDADILFKSEYPEIHTYYHNRNNIEKSIRSDSIFLKRAKENANKLYLSLEEYLRYFAEEQLKGKNK